MLRRFVSAAAIASMAIACGAAGLLIVARVYELQEHYLLAALWCFVPLAWGIWAMLAPASWVPARLPNWGAILGLIASVNALFVINIPERILEQAVSTRFRWAMVLVAVVMYYLLWTAVRAIYRALTPDQPAKSYKIAA